MYQYAPIQDPIVCILYQPCSIIRDVVYQIWWSCLLKPQKPNLYTLPVFKATDWEILKINPCS